MKKIFSLCALALAFLTCGLVLTACNEKEYSMSCQSDYIELRIDELTVNYSKIKSNESKTVDVYAVGTVDASQLKIYQNQSEVDLSFYDYDSDVVTAEKVKVAHFNLEGVNENLIFTTNEIVGKQISIDFSFANGLTEEQKEIAKDFKFSTGRTLAGKTLYEVAGTRVSGDANTLFKVGEEWYDEGALNLDMQSQKLAGTYKDEFFENGDLQMFEGVMLRYKAGSRKDFYMDFTQRGLKTTNAITIDTSKVEKAKYKINFMQYNSLGPVTSQTNFDEGFTLDQPFTFTLNLDKTHGINFDNFKLKLFGQDFLPTSRTENQVTYTLDKLPIEYIPNLEVLGQGYADWIYKYQIEVEGLTMANPVGLQKVEVKTYFDNVTITADMDYFKDNNFVYYDKANPLGVFVQYTFADDHRFTTYDPSVTITFEDSTIADISQKQIDINLSEIFGIDGAAEFDFVGGMVKVIINWRNLPTSFDPNEIASVKVEVLDVTKDLTILFN